MSPSPQGIVAAGHWIVDISKRIDHWPEPQTLAIIDQVQSTNGGAAFNVACDLRRLDESLPVEGAGLVGKDTPGDFVLETCQSRGIGTQHLIQTDDFPTSFTDAMTEKKTGRRTFFHLSGANAGLGENHLDPAAFQAKIFFLAYLGLLETLDRLDSTGRNGSSRIFEKASALGMLTATDLVSAPNENLAAQVRPCLPHLDLLFTNEWEAARLTGEVLPSGIDVSYAEAADLAGRVVAMGVRGTVVLHFSGGAVAVSSKGERFAQGAVKVPAEEIVGTTGAGDAFAAGYLLGTHLGLTTPECLELAVCSAATSLHAITCSDSIRPWKDCLTYGRSHGFRPSAL